MAEQNYEDVNAYMTALDDTHNPEGVEEGFSKVPDNKYQTKLDKLYIARSKGKTKRLQLVIEFDVLNGTYAFRKIFKFCGLETADQLDYATRDLRRLGIVNFKWSTVQTQFKDVLDKLYEVEVKTNDKGFTNVYIQEQLDTSKVMVSKTLNKDKDVPF